MHQFDHFAHDPIDVARHGVGLAILAEGKHVHHQGRDLALVAIDHRPALANYVLVVLRQARLDQVAAAADALQDVLDVMREHGDGLAHGSQSFGLHHRRVVASVFHGQRRLMGDGDHQLQMFLGKLVLVSQLLDHALRRGRSVDIDHAHHVVATLHGHADRLADAHLHDAGRVVPALVLAGVAGQHSLVVLQDVVQDGLADRNLLARFEALPSVPHLGLKLLGLLVEQHDAAAVGLDPIEDQLHDAIEQLIDVERMADGQRRAVHDLQIAAGPRQPGAATVLVFELKQLAAFLLAHRAHDARALGGLAPSDDVDLVRQVVGHVLAGIGEQHRRAANLQLVARGQLACFGDPLAVDVRAVRAAQVGHHAGHAVVADFGVSARDFGVVNLDVVRGVAPQAQRALFEIEERSLVVALINKKRRHRPTPMYESTPGVCPGGKHSI